MQNHEEFLDRYFKVTKPGEQQEMLGTYMLSLSAEDLQEFVLGNLRTLRNEAPGLSESEKAEVLAILDRAINLVKEMKQRF